MRRRRERSEIRRQKSEKTIVKTDSALWRNLQVRRQLARITPARARLPLKFWWRSFRKTLEPEASFLLQQRWEHGIAIDVGANEGLYSYVLAKLFDRVEAFEPNEAASAELRDYGCPKINLHRVALSRSEGERTLHVPILAHGVVNVGYGSLERETLPPSENVTTQIVQTRTLDSYGFENVVFIKIDVEGHELQVLEGATETIACCRPIMLLEIKTTARSSVFAFLKDRQFGLFYLLHGKLTAASETVTVTPAPQENFFAIPKEKSKLESRKQIEKDLEKRTKEFALSAIKFVSSLPRTREADVLGRQLLRSATSVGANYREANRGVSRADFANKIGTVQKEAAETQYWLELLIESGLSKDDSARELLKE
jgi:four helix bundle protein